MTDIPETYNELVELIENNDPGVVAQVIEDNYTRKDKLEGLAGWMGKRVDDHKRKANLHGVESGELKAFYEGIAIGRERSQKEIERKIQ